MKKILSSYFWIALTGVTFLYSDGSYGDSFRVPAVPRDHEFLCRSFELAALHLAKNPDELDAFVEAFFGANSELQIVLADAAVKQAVNVVDAGGPVSVKRTCFEYFRFRGA